MRNTCLNCKYEPDWGDPIGNEYPRRYGNCKFLPKIPPLPPTITVGRPEKVVRHSDDSGIHRGCKVWEEKDEVNADNSTN